MTIKAGAMREQVTFERRTETVEPSGAVSVAWELVQNLRAELVQADAQSFLGSVERLEDRKVFRLWAAAWINTELRLTHGNYTYRIVQIVPLDQLGLELHCVNAVNEVQP